MEGYNSTRGDGYFLTRLRIAAGAFRFVSHAKYAEARQFDLLATLEAIGQFLKKGLNHFLGFTVVESDLVGEVFGQVCFGYRHACMVSEGHASNSRSKLKTQKPLKERLL